MACINWEDLPKTFQDAIVVVRSLGINYLWIDSLCIVQDDIDDWVRESEQMGYIYENSRLKIAATSAPNATAGLYLKDKIRRKISGTISNREGFEYVVFKMHKHPEKDMPWDEKNINWPLLNRAWVFQEQILPPRTIHFSRHELIWECRRHIQCECEPRHRGYFRSPKKEYYRILEEGLSGNLVELWQEICERYSPLDLTKASDKLPALSGLAKQMDKRRPQATYLAGMWSDSLDRDLLWMNHGDQYLDSSAEGSFKNHLPSWSWAKTRSSTANLLSSDYVDGKMILQIYFTISDAVTSLATTDPTGDVQGGLISIKAPVFDATFVDTGRNDFALARIRFGLVVGISGQQVKVYLDHRNEVYFDVPTDPFVDSREPPIDHGHFKLIHMARIRHDASLESDYAMVVQRLASSSTFQRIGMFSVTRFLDYDAQHVENATMERIWEEKPSILDGGTVETITIV